MIIERIPKYSEKETINEETMHYSLPEFLKQIKIIFVKIKAKKRTYRFK